MKNSASWLPISAVSGCYVQYRGGGAEDERRKLLWTPALYDQYYHSNGPHSPTYSIAPLHCAHYSSQISFQPSSWVCVCVWWVLVRGVAGYVTRGEARRMSGAANCGMTALRTWRERSNEGEWQRCGDKASRQSPRRLVPTPHPSILHPWGGTADRTKEILNIAVDEPNIGFVKGRRQLSSLLLPLPVTARPGTTTQLEDSFFFPH